MTSRAALKLRRLPALGRASRAVAALRARTGIRSTTASAEAGRLSPAEMAGRRDVEDTVNMRRLLAFLLRADACCVDVGAHRGAVLAEMLRVAPRGHHVAIEPLPHLAAQLRTSFPGVTVHECALSDRSGRSEFAHVRGAAEGWSGLRFRPLPAGGEAAVEFIEVALAPLDELLDPDFRPAVIKIDVEGAEQQVLRGALRTLRQHRPTIIFEHGHGSAETFDTLPRDVYELLSHEVGMRIFDMDGNGPYSLSDLERTFYGGTRVNFVAHP